MAPIGNAATDGPGAPDSGRLVFPGRYEDVNIDLLALAIPGANNAPDPVSIPGTGLFIAGFPAVGITEVSVNGMEYPHSARLAPNAIVRPHSHMYTVTYPGAGDVYMQFEIRVTRLGKTPLTTTVGVIVQPLPTLFTDEVIVPLPSIDISSVADGIGTQMAWRFFRDPSHPNDTFTGEVGFTTLGLHVQYDTLGSTEVFAK